MTTAVFLRSTTSSSSSRLRKVTLTMQSLLHTAAALQRLPTQHIHTKHATCSTGQSVMREPTSWVCRATHAGCQRGTCQAHGTHTRKASSERKLTQKCFHTQQPVCHTHLQPTADHQASPTPHLFTHQERHGVRRHPTKSLCLSFRHLETQS